MELADDHLAGREIDIVSYEPRTLKSDLGRQKRCRPMNRYASVFR